MRYTNALSRFFIHILTPFLLLLVFYSCSTSKNTIVHRAYHNLTAHYNVQYYSDEAIDDGIYKVKKNHNENYEEVLPVFIYPTEENVKSTFPEFDRAIKKSTRCIQMHAIKDEKGNVIPKSGKWIDNCWINIGIARIYKRELFSGIEALDYAARTWNHSKDKYTAILWMIRAYNEAGAVSMSEPLISLLKNEKKLPKKIKNQIPVVEADYYLRRGLYSEAFESLKKAVKNKNIFSGIKKEDRARYHFIMGQMMQEQNKNKEAVREYSKCYKLKSDFDLMFYSKIKLATLTDVKRQNPEPVKKQLLKMSKEAKYVDNRDVIFYTLGLIEENQGNKTKSKEYFKESVRTSTKNQNQKAYSFLKLGEIYFEDADYERSEKYYDSTLASLSKNHPRYKKIQERQAILKELVNHLTTIRREDSLIRFVSLNPEEQNRLIDKLIQNFKDEEKRKKELSEKNNVQQQQNNFSGFNDFTSMNTDPFTSFQASASGPVSFYFYNQNTVMKGMVDFVKKWGNRKNEDNWRRSNKTPDVSFSNQADNTNLINNDNPQKEEPLDPRATREYYLKNLPKGDSAISKSKRKLFNAYIQAGTIYKEDLKNYSKATQILEELNTKYPNNPYKLNAYLLLYRTGEARGSQKQKEEYKEKIISEFPQSEMAKFLLNPDYLKDKKTEISEIEKFYALTLEQYKVKNYPEVISTASKCIREFGYNAYTPKFEYLRAMSWGYYGRTDSMEFYLKKLTILYPKSEQAEAANRTLLELEKMRKMNQPQKEAKKTLKDTFLYKPELEHFIVIACPDNTNEVEKMKGKIFFFNSKFFSNANFQITSVIFKQGIQWIIIKPFTKTDDAIHYYKNLMQDLDVFDSEAARQQFVPFVISTENYILLNKIKAQDEYMEFFNEKYSIKQ